MTKQKTDNLRITEENDQELKIETPQRPSKEQMIEWEDKFGATFTFFIGGCMLVIRKPKVVDLERAMAADPKKKKAFNFHRSIINNCKLYIEDDIVTDDDNFIALCSQIDEAIEMRDGEIKKNWRPGK